MTIKKHLTILIWLFGSVLPFAAQERQLIQGEETPPLHRVALVIGNGDYAVARKLSNPVNDANDMAQTLRDVGFEVVAGTNLNLKQMTDKVREFGDKLKASGGVGLFYYAGHGVQISNRNYLIPIEADVSREDEIDFSALNFDQVLRKMATANNGLNIVVLDACRNNPFARSWNRGDDKGGLAQISAPSGTFIAYATSPDQTASDGTGRNGLYTAELLKFIRQPNLKIEETFKEVRKAVNKASGGKQIPWDSSSLSGDFYFNDLRTAKNSAGKKQNKKSAAQPPEIVKPQPDKIVNSTRTVRILDYRDRKAPDGDWEMGVIIENFDRQADIKIFINNVDVSSSIESKTENGVIVHGSLGELNISGGRNALYVVVNGVKSNVMILMHFVFEPRR